MRIRKESVEVSVDALHFSHIGETVSMELAQNVRSIVVPSTTVIPNSRGDMRAASSPNLEE